MGMRSSEAQLSNKGSGAVQSAEQVNSQLPQAFPAPTFQHYGGFVFIVLRYTLTLLTL